MTQRLDKQQLRELAIAVSLPAGANPSPATVDRGFGLPTGL